ncbi:MAG: ferrous iron transport protein B, partial [Bacteroidota bacterium]|nr:ferrous iron transport protein B [Bacteroidota bacterium]
SKMLGIPIVPTVSVKGTGLNELFEKVIEVYEGKNNVIRHIHINYGQDIEDSISRLRKILRKNRPVTDAISSRYVALRLLEKDPESEQLILDYSEKDAIRQITAEEIQRIERLVEDETHSLITGYRYGFISGALKETFVGGKNHSTITTEQIDVFLTHKYLGIPFFLLFMFLSFYCTFELGAYPMNWINAGVHALGGIIERFMSEGMLRDLIVDGIINGLGSVLVFIPNILILFFFISFMEDTGYMARAAFIMDKVMHGFGLHGRSFIPLVMGFGCNVPAIMATRTLRNKKDRVLTMLIIPFMSCSARLPVYVLLISAFFPSHRALFLTGLYVVGIMLALIMAQVFNKTLFRSKESPFVMELPPYRLPTLKNTMIHMWDKAQQYLRKIGGVILLAVVIVWALGYFPVQNKDEKLYNQKMSELKQRKEQILKSSSVAQSFSLNQKGISDMREPQLKSDSLKQIQGELESLSQKRESEKLKNSYLGHIGRIAEPVMRPLGFDWKMTVCLLSGLPAKEIVVSTMGVLYQANEGDSNLADGIKKDTYQSGERTGQTVFNPLVALSFLIFVLIYFPCIGVVMSISRESGSSWWSVFVICYTTLLAWMLSFAVFQIGSMI